MVKYTCYEIRKKGEGMVVSGFGKEQMEKECAELNAKGDGEYYIDWHSWETTPEQEKWTEEVGEIAEQGINSYKAMEEEEIELRDKLIEMIEDYKWKIIDGDPQPEPEEFADKILELVR